MVKAQILHLLTPEKQVSPFDVNMAVDAGFAHVQPYTQITLSDIHQLVQDAIYSRGLKNNQYTSLFIGGSNITLADEMITKAKQAMHDPFHISVLADPRGAYTTAVATVLLLLKHLKGKSLKNKRIVIFGGSGAVGGAIALLASELQARVVLASHRNQEAIQYVVERYNHRYHLDLIGAEAKLASQKVTLLRDAHIIINAAQTGVRVISENQLHHAEDLELAVDLNIASPTGIEGINNTKQKIQLLPTPKQALGLSASCVGRIKNKVQQQLLHALLHTDTIHFFDLHYIFKYALENMEK